MTFTNLHKLEGTKVLDSGAVWHYTCNAPSQKVLDFYNISTIGDIYSRDSREVLIIPSEAFENEGMVVPEDENVLTINAETLLKRLRLPQ
tara:strand:+ start:614 stop:883 length:270 start_codon:yes stop_codon:yes gene_type:complete